MGFYQEIQRTFGIHASKTLKHWATINTKLASLLNRRVFLLQCRQHAVFPNHIVHSLKNINNLLSHHEGPLGNQINNFDINIRKKILNLEIGITISSINQLQKDLEETIKKADSLLPHNICNDFNNTLLRRYRNLFNSIKTRNVSKLKLLRDQKFATISTQAKWIKNISDLTIPSDISKLLSLGPKFSVTTDISHVKVPNLLADLETIISPFDDKQKNMYRGQFNNIIINYLHKMKDTKSVFTKVIIKTKKFLKDHPELIITLSDKGNVTVAMNRTDYLTLSHNLLSDHVYYKLLSRDPTLTLERRGNNLIKSLHHKAKLDDITTKRLTSYNSLAPRFYALPKIHKPELAVRPIISCINAPNSKLSKFLTDILTKAYNTDNEFYISDSFRFSAFIDEFQLPPNYILISLDVVSLFTNLPLNLARDCMIEKWEDISRHTNLDLVSFLEIVDFVFDSTFFIFDNQYYKQIQGLPMGASISPIASSYVLDDLVRSSVDKLSFPIPFLKRYVDDLILAVPNGSIEEVLTVFNQACPQLQFTFEQEINNRIPFLDMTLIRTPDNRIITQWYSKQICSGRYLNFFSNHPTKMKLGLVTTLTNRVSKLTHHSLLIDSINKLKTLLYENSYPKKIVNRLCNNVPPRIDIHAIVPPAQDTITLYGVLPYINELTPRLINIFKERNIKFSTRCDNNLKFLYTPLKTPIHTQQKFNVVYNIPCNDCNLNYIGQTSRSLKNRIISHKSDSRLGKRSCALSEHVIQQDHRMNYNNSSIIFKETNYSKRKFLEMVAIHNKTTTMNKRSDTEELSSIYFYTLELFKTLTQDSQLSTTDQSH